MLAVERLRTHTADITNDRRSIGRTPSIDLSTVRSTRKRSSRRTARAQLTDSAIECVPVSKTNRAMSVRLAKPVTDSSAAAVGHEDDSGCAAAHPHRVDCDRPAAQHSRRLEHGSDRGAHASTKHGHRAAFAQTKWRRSTEHARSFGRLGELATLLHDLLVGAAELGRDVALVNDRRAERGMSCRTSAASLPGDGNARRDRSWPG